VPGLRHEAVSWRRRARNPRRGEARTAARTDGHTGLASSGRRLVLTVKVGFPMNYDVIIVGARCSGAALGTLLARSGVKTLILDADSLPSDMPMSTHYVHPPGMDVLDELGVG